MKITTEYPTEDKQNRQNQIFIHFRLVVSVYFWAKLNLFRFIIKLQLFIAGLSCKYINKIYFFFQSTLRMGFKFLIFQFSFNVFTIIFNMFFFNILVLNICTWPTNRFSFIFTIIRSYSRIYNFFKSTK